MIRLERRLGVMLAAPLLIGVAAILHSRGTVFRDDPDGRFVMRRLAQEIVLHPNQKVYRLTRIRNYRNHLIDLVMSEDAWNEYEVVFDAKSKTLQEYGVNLSQSWQKVDREDIGAVARESGTFRNLTRYGCLDVHP